MHKTTDATQLLTMTVDALHDDFACRKQSQPWIGFSTRAHQRHITHSGLAPRILLDQQHHILLLRPHAHDFSKLHCNDPCWSQWCFRLQGTVLPMDADAAAAEPSSGSLNIVVLQLKLLLN